MATSTTQPPDLRELLDDDRLETLRPEAESDRREPAPPRGSAEAPREPAPLRPIIAAALAASAAGLVTGGIFGVWSARLLGLFAALFGAFWGWLTLRSPRERTSVLLGILPIASLAIGAVLLIPAEGGPNELPRLVTEAVAGGRLLRPPVPFDPGWRPIIMLVLSLLGFGTVWVGAALERPLLAIAVPLPVLALTAITQPDEGALIAGLCGFIPLLAALAVLFSGDNVRASELTRAFELKRAVRALAAAVATVVSLVLLSNANFLFPEPVYDPSEQPQKPKAIPITGSQDRVLFEVQTDPDLTGPWKTGTLDVYEGNSWRLPPYNTKRFKPVPADGIVNGELLGPAPRAVQFTVRDLGNTATLPGTATPAKIERPAGFAVNFDPRADVFRVPEGRVPKDSTYSISLPPYPDAAQLTAAPPRRGNFSETLNIPNPPDSVKRLLAGAPSTPAWARLDFMRKALREVAVAAGAGVPKDVPPSRVAQILDGKHEASPFELVAAEAMLARWAGIPARIGFGFDGLNEEDGVFTVRPKNAAQWLEVYFEEHGWIPLINAPPKAKVELDADPNARFNPTTLPSDDVAVELYIPIRVHTPKLLYQSIRGRLLAVLPYALLAAAAYLSSPAAMKAWRRWKRRRWAEAIGARAQVAVEYAEFRDFAHDLNVGDPYDTSLEYLKKVVDDDQHAELAWLVARTIYGDLATTLTDEDARAAEELSASLRRRMFRAQPAQSRVLAILSKASLRQPYSDEIPNVRTLEPLSRLAGIFRRVLPAKRRVRGPRPLVRLPGVPLPWRR